LSNHYMLVINASNIDKIFNWLQEHLFEGVSLKDISKDTSLLAIQGPMSRDVLKSFYPNIDSLKYYETLMPDADGIIVARTGYSGELGFEIYVPNNKIIDLWNQLLAASHDIRPVGLGCRDSLRLEMGYCLYGHELNESTNPIEAGLSWITKIDTGFIGSESLSDINIEKKLVPLVLTDRAIPRAEYKIFDDNDNNIGFITSGGMSPSTGNGIALAYIDMPYAKDLKQFNVKIRNKTFVMDKIKLPFYKEGTFLK